MLDVEEIATEASVGTNRENERFNQRAIRGLTGLVQRSDS